MLSLLARPFSCVSYLRSLQHLPFSSLALPSSSHFLRVLSVPFPFSSTGECGGSLRGRNVLFKWEKCLWACTLTLWKEAKSSCHSWGSSARWMPGSLPCKGVTESWSLTFWVRDVSHGYQGNSWNCTGTVCAQMLYQIFGKRHQVNRRRLGKRHWLRLGDASHTSKIKIPKASGRYRVSSSAVLNQGSSVKSKALVLYRLPTDSGFNRIVFANLHSGFCFSVLKWVVPNS